MKKRISSFFVFLFVSSCSHSFLAPIPLALAAKPFKRALVFTGGGTSFISYYTYIEGARKYWPGFEDEGTVIIAACGGAVGAAVSQLDGSDDPDRVIREFKDKQTQDLSDINFNFSFFGSGWNWAREVVFSSKSNPTFPNIFTETLHQAPQDVFNYKFGGKKKENAPALIIIGGKILFSKEQVSIPLILQNNSQMKSYLPILLS